MDARQLYVLDLVHLALAIARAGETDGIQAETRARLASMLDDLVKELHTQDVESIGELASSLGMLAIDPQPMCGATDGQQGPDKVTWGNLMFALASPTEMQVSIHQGESPSLSAPALASTGPGATTVDPRLLLSSDDHFVKELRNLSLVPSHICQETQPDPLDSLPAVREHEGSVTSSPPSNNRPESRDSDSTNE